MWYLLVVKPGFDQVTGVPADPCPPAGFVKAAALLPPVDIALDSLKVAGSLHLVLCAALVAAKVVACFADLGGCALDGGAADWAVECHAVCFFFICS